MNEISHDPEVRALEHFKDARTLIASGWHSIRFGIAELGGKGREAETAQIALETLKGPFGKLHRLIIKMERQNAQRKI